MRRLPLLSSFLVPFAVGAAVLAGQAPPAGQTDPSASSPSATATAQPPKDTKLVTMVGCIAGADETAKAANTFVDAKQGVAYRLTGRDVREYAGSRVQITGTTDSRRIHIQGGLLPNTNVAAQAGAIDPGQAAIATANQGIGTAPTSGTPLTEFRVRSVRPVKGPCPRP